MDTVEADIYSPSGCKSALDLLEASLPKFKPTLREALYHITDNWNAIITNDLRADEVRNFLSRIETFGKRTEQFDNFCTDLDRKSEAPQLNPHIGREYYLSVYDTLDQFSNTITAIKRTQPQQLQDTIYKGIARKLHKYVRTATDTDWENLITNGTPFRNTGKWEGTRVEATLLGTLLNIPAATLNKSLTFPTSNGTPRKINYAQDKITCSIDTYEIYPLLKDYIERK